MMSHPDFVYWALLSMCVCVCVFVCLDVGVCVEDLLIERVEGLEKAPSNPYSALPLFHFFPLFFSSCRQSSQPTCPTKAQPSGKGPEKTSPPLKPHIGQKRAE